jgi:uncharacterized protein YacL
MLAISGYQFVELLQSRGALPTGAAEITAIILAIIVGSGLGYVLGGVFGRWLDRILKHVESHILKIPGSDLVAAIAGLVLGLIIAALVSMGLRLIPIVGPYLPILSFVILGFLGMRLALRRKKEFGSLFHTFSPEATRPQSGTVSGLPPLIPAEKILDTSVIIDGRIIDISRTGFMEGRLIVPRFVLRELQNIADSEDALKRNRGRRGLDTLNALQREPKVEVHILEKDYPELGDVDAKLVRIAKETGGTVVTNDYNLNKIAELQGVRVLNINELANALKPIVLPGEEMSIHILKEGKEAGQGVGYLDDGTMVVVEGGRRHVGEEADVLVTSVLQTPAGRMIFVKLKGPEAGG